MFPNGTSIRSSVFAGLSGVLYRQTGGAVVSGVRRMNEVNACRVRLVGLLGCVTVFGRVYHLGM